MGESKISKKQLVANRENAQKSTGPTTAEGKQISAQNSIKHGLHVRDTIINSAFLKENKYEYEELLESLFDELKPTTVFQKQLVLKIANCLWRSRRVIVAETSIINRQMDSLENNSYYNDLTEQLDEIPELPPDPNFDDDMQEMRVKIAQKRSNLVGAKIVPQLELNTNILRYEMRLDRQLTRAYRLFKSLQFQEEMEKIQKNHNIDDSKSEK